MKTLSNTLIPALLCLTLAACSAQTRPVAATTITGPEVPQLEVSAAKRWQDGGEHATLNVQLSRASLTGAVRISIEGLPQGLRAEPVTLTGNQTDAKLEISGNPDCLDTDTTLTIRAQAGGLEITQTFDLSELRPKRNPKGGTATATLDGLNLGSSRFSATSVYANLSGIACQVMLQSPGRSLYVCFNGPIRPGTYTLAERCGVDAPGTASMTYLETPRCGQGTKPVFYDSASGTLEVIEASHRRIRFEVRDARMTSAKGFEINQAAGEFVIGASVNVNDIVQAN